MEQTDVTAGTGPSGPVMPPRPAFSNEVRASMEAIRVAREAAHLRARRQTLQTRIWFAMSMAAVALAAFAFGPRIARWRHAPAHATSAARPSPRAPEPAAPATAVAAAVEAPAASSGKAEALPVPVTAPAAIAEPQAAEREGGPSEKACDTALIRSAPWRLSPDACAHAFDADPGNAALALAVAHGTLVRGRFTEAGQWATRALALDPKVAEAYVIFARAEIANGRPEDARAAYRHYLELAPRGWHQNEARAALRAPDSAGGR